MSKLAWKGGALLAPLPPVLVTCGTLEAPNVLTVAWTGLLNTRPPKTYVSIRPERHSHGLIIREGAFVINLTTEALVRAVDFCGVRSGREMDKLAQLGLATEPCPEVPCPMLKDSPLALACRVTDRVPLGSHDMFVADILSVHVEEALVDEKGKLDLERAGLLAYAHGAYYALGERLGTFGYSVKKPVKRRKTHVSG